MKINAWSSDTTELVRQVSCRHCIFSITCGCQVVRLGRKLSHKDKHIAISLCDDDHLERCVLISISRNEWYDSLSERSLSLEKSGETTSLTSPSMSKAWVSISYIWVHHFVGTFLTRWSWPLMRVIPSSFEIIAISSPREISSYELSKMGNRLGASFLFGMRNLSDLQ